jgi:hypothetical protein
MLLYVTAGNAPPEGSLADEVPLIEGGFRVSQTCFMACSPELTGSPKGMRDVGR